MEYSLTVGDEIGFDEKRTYVVILSETDGRWIFSGNFHRDLEAVAECAVEYMNLKERPKINFVDYNRPSDKNSRIQRTPIAEGKKRRLMEILAERINYAMENRTVLEELDISTDFA